MIFCAVASAELAVVSSIMQLARGIGESLYSAEPIQPFHRSNFPPLDTVGAANTPDDFLVGAMQEGR
jgi:hypothetical protein